MQEIKVRIAENLRLAAGVHRMTLEDGELAPVEAGQFVNILLDGFFLRRPLSVFDSEPGRLTVIYKTVGRGTRYMESLDRGQTLSILSGLGNGYDLDASGRSPLLVGGGVGVPPLYLAAKRLTAQGKNVHAVLGFNTGEDVFAVEEFEALGCHVRLTTVDGSRGIKGFATDVLPEETSYFYACGPEPMLRAVYRATKTSGEFSFEERMGCGFGACMGCTCRTLTGTKRLCTEGPVLRKEEILWAD